MYYTYVSYVSTLYPDVSTRRYLATDKDGKVHHAKLQYIKNKDGVKELWALQGAIQEPQNVEEEGEEGEEEADEPPPPKKKETKKSVAASTGGSSSTEPPKGPNPKPKGSKKRADPPVVAEGSRKSARSRGQ